MPNDNHDDGNSDEPKSRKNQNTRAIMAMLIVAAILFGVLSFIAWYFVNEHSERIKFLTINTLSLFVLVAIIIQAYIYRSQREIMNEQADIMRKQVKMMDKSLVIGTRAYVGIHSVQLKKDPHAIYIKIENIGHVPAEEVKVFVEIMTLVHDKFLGKTPGVRHKTRKSFDRDYGRTKLFRGNLQIALGITLRAYFSEQEIDLILQGNSFLGIRGHIEYRNGFDRTRTQETEFVFYYVSSDDSWVAGTPDDWDEGAKNEEANPN